MPQTRNRSRQLAPDEVCYKDIVVKRQIDQGNFGTIHKATLWGQDVALKMLKSDGLDVSTEGQDTEKDFQHEVNVLRQLRHPNLVEMMAVCQIKPKQCIVTEYCEHGSLYDFLARHHLRNRLPLSVVLDMAIDVAAGLNWMHHKGFIHRDIKPQNILVARGFVFKIADFGLTEAIKGDTRSKSESYDMIKDYLGDDGTYWYMAPEVLADGKYGCRCDVYSFGVMLCELLHPKCFVGYVDVEHKSETEKQRFVDAVQDGLRPELPTCDDVPEALLRLLTSCFHKEHDSRPVMDSVLGELRTIRKSVLRNAEPILVAELIEQSAKEPKNCKKRSVREGKAVSKEKEKELKKKDSEIKKLKAQLLDLQKKGKAKEKTVAAKEKTVDKPKPKKNSAKDNKRQRPKRKMSQRVQAENVRPKRHRGMLEMLSNPLRDITNSYYDTWALF